MIVGLQEKKVLFRACAEQRPRPEGAIVQIQISHAMLLMMVEENPIRVIFNYVIGSNAAIWEYSLAPLLVW